MRTDFMSIIFANSGDEQVSNLTAMRCMASVPYGGRYRLIDFCLSNMVNAGVSKVAILTAGKYHSLMDHLGSGKSWDLARKKNGISLFPPFVLGGADNNNRVAQLITMLNMLEHSSEDYVVICDTDTVYGVDIEDMLKYHISNGSDITLAYSRGIQPKSINESRMVFDIDGENRIRDILLSPNCKNDCNFSLNLVIISRKLLIQKINDARMRNCKGIAKDMLIPSLVDSRIMGYEVKGFAAVIDSMQTYYNASMSLLSDEIRHELFRGERPVYTKVRDEMPTKYGHNASVSNCLAADGCIIEGTVENCILFRDVRIAKGAHVSNSILMQGTEIGEDTELNYVITDKEVVINGGNYMSSKNNPLFFEKEMKV